MLNSFSPHLFNKTEFCSWSIQWRSIKDWLSTPTFALSLRSFSVKCESLRKNAEDLLSDRIWEYSGSLFHSGAIALETFWVSRQQLICEEMTTFEPFRFLLLHLWEWCLSGSLVISPGVSLRMYMRIYCNNPQPSRQMRNISSNNRTLRYLRIL